MVPCIICGALSEPSAVGTPTCSAECTSKVSDVLLPLFAHRLYTQGDGSGGMPSRVLPPKPKEPPRPRTKREGAASVELARERLGDCRTVLERHGVVIRGSMAFCPFHEHRGRTPSMALDKRGDHDHAKCFACDWYGNAIDLEADLTHVEVIDVIRTWGRW